MPKRRREEEETLETGNVDQGDFSDGDSDEEETDDVNEKTDKYDVMREDDIEGILLESVGSFIDHKTNNLFALGF